MTGVLGIFYSDKGKASDYLKALQTWIENDENKRLRLSVRQNDDNQVSMKAKFLLI